jgi:hypothetical protein
LDAFLVHQALKDVATVASFEEESLDDVPDADAIKPDVAEDVVIS